MSGFPADRPLTPYEIKQLYIDGFEGAPIDIEVEEALFTDGIVKDSMSIQHLVQNIQVMVNVLYYGVHANYMIQVLLDKNLRRRATV